MASYTEHYQLHQWEPEDPFLRTDFNQDFQEIDTAIADAAKAPCCVSGEFIGNGSSSNIELGFCPSFLEIMAPNRGSNLAYDMIAAIGGNGYMLSVTRDFGCTITTVCQSTETGFVVTDDSATGLNTNGITYQYLAFY